MIEKMHYILIDFHSANGKNLLNLHRFYDFTEILSIEYLYLKSLVKRNE